MKVVIIEDEKLAANHLEKMITKYDPSVKVLAKLESVEDSIDWFTAHGDPDLIFLDIHLDDGLSFAIFEKVKVSAPIIFTTAYDEYAIKAFKMKSIDYLLKPILPEELYKAIDKYKEWQAPGNAAIDMQSLVDLISKRDPVYKARFSITVGEKIKSVGIEQIAYFYSSQGITFLVTNENLHYPIDLSLEQLAEQLNPTDFFRINRQFLIRLKAIRNVHVYPKSRLKIDLTPAYPDEIFVSIDKVTRFKAWLDA
jgi:DNA-binding LytR/AlgR family response regulator